MTTGGDRWLDVTLSSASFQYLFIPFGFQHVQHAYTIPLLSPSIILLHHCGLLFYTPRQRSHLLYRCPRWQDAEEWLSIRYAAPPREAAALLVFRSEVARYEFGWAALLQRQMSASGKSKAKYRSASNATVKEIDAFQIGVKQFK